jgi:hypothetical protein
MSIIHDASNSKQIVSDICIKEMQHATAAKVLGSSANVPH